MAANNSTTISLFALKSYLAYWLCRSKPEISSLDFGNLPFEIAGVQHKALLRAFGALKTDGLLEEFVSCEDGIWFMRSPHLLALI